MKKILIFSLSVFLASAHLSTVAMGAPFIFDGPEAKLSAGEISAFKKWMLNIKPEPTNEGNAWAFGHSGQAMEALGLLYTVSGDVEFLERMATLASICLSQRNDLAPSPVGHRKMWSGPLSPVWPNEATNVSPFDHAGPESADVAGHIGYCAELILKHPSLFEKTIPDSNPGNFGATYLARAQAFVKALDETEDLFVVPSFVNKSRRGRYYYPKSDAYRASLTTTDNSGEAVPWNQQFMINNLLQRLAECHELLKTSRERVLFNDQCVEESLKWFFSTVTTRKGAANRPYYSWQYSDNKAIHVEDLVHAGLDIQGLYRCYLSGRYRSLISAEQLKAFANTMFDRVRKGPGQWSGSVDGDSGPGHAAATDFPRANILLLLEFRPDVFSTISGEVMSSKRSAGDPTAMTHLIWTRARIRGEVPADEHL